MPRKTRQFGLRSAVPGPDRTRTAANREGTYRCCGKSLSSASSSGSIREIPVKDRGIRVNALSPGSIDTPGLSDLLASSETGQQRLKMLASAVPLGRLGTPDEIAKAVVFLASDDSSYVTGTELFVDGGFAQV